MKKLSISFGGVIIASLVVQFLGLIKTTYLSAVFGAGHTLDAFYLATALTISVFSIVNTTVMTIVIPELNDNDNPDRESSVNDYIGIICIGAFLLSLLLLAVATIFVNQIAPNFSPSYQELFLELTAVLIVSQQFRIQAALSTAVLQNEGIFVIPRFLDSIPVLLPLITLVLIPAFGIFGVTFGAAIGYIVETILLFYVQKKYKISFHYRLSISLSKKVKYMLKNTVPIFISSTIFQLQLLLSNYFAGLFSAGTVTMLNNANQIMGMFQGLFIANLVNIMYPKIVRGLSAKTRNYKILSKSIMSINALVVLLIWGYAAVGEKLIILLFQRGHFTVENAHTVYQMGLILGSVLQFDVVREVLYRAHYAQKDTRTPMRNSITTVIFNIVLLIVASHFIGAYSIVVAPAIGTIFSMCSIIYRSAKNGMLVGFLPTTVFMLYMNIVGFLMYDGIKIINLKIDSVLLSLIFQILLGIVIAGVIIGATFGGTRLVSNWFSRNRSNEE